MLNNRDVFYVTVLLIVALTYVLSLPCCEKSCVDRKSFHQELDKAPIEVPFVEETPVQNRWELK